MAGHRILMSHLSGGQVKTTRTEQAAPDREGASLKTSVKLEVDVSGAVVREVDDLAAVEFGLRRIHLPSGELVEETHYRFGRPHGKSRTWNPSGILTSEASYEAGELHGDYRSWWDNGRLKEEGRYVLGKRVGNYVWYKSDGSVWSTQLHPASP